MLALTRYTSISCGMSAAPFLIVQRKFPSYQQKWFSSSEYEEPKVSPQDKIFIALSSGVDSSVAAALLLKSGHPRENLVPFYMANWSSSANPPSTELPLLPFKKPRKPPLQPIRPDKDVIKCTEREFTHVREICSSLGLQDPLQLSLEKEYWNDVFIPMVEMYRSGLTPNPDVDCNRAIKFGAVVPRLRAEFEKTSGPGNKWWLATGHYARILNHKPTKTPHLLRSKDLNKDQTFYLSTIVQSTLPHLLFPLGSHGLEKPAVKALARKLQLPGWRNGEPEREESMGLCFVEPGGGRRRSAFRQLLNEYLEPEPGEIVVGPGKIYEGEEIESPPEGTVVGTHEGLWHATIGEKARLELPQADPRYTGRWYVSLKNRENNQLEVVKGLGNARLFGKGMVAGDWRWLGQDAEDLALNDKNPPTDGNAGEQALVLQFRHRQTPLHVAKIEIIESSGNIEVGLLRKLRIILDSPAKAIAPGQSVALWFGERCLGGGVIEEFIGLN